MLDSILDRFPHPEFYSYLSTVIGSAHGTKRQFVKPAHVKLLVLSRQL